MSGLLVMKDEFLIRITLRLGTPGLYTVPNSKMFLDVLVCILKRYFVMRILILLTSSCGQP